MDPGDEEEVREYPTAFRFSSLDGTLDYPLYQGQPG